MSIIRWAYFKCGNCGKDTMDHFYFSKSNFDEEHSSEDDFLLGECKYCHKKFNKQDCFIKLVEDKESEDDVNAELSKPSFIKAKE